MPPYDGFELTFHVLLVAAGLVMAGLVAWSVYRVVARIGRKNRRT